ncbi:pilus assembly protein [Kineobactrum salinum]|uniref:PilY1 beta-propeller domain-containing protein n=1 Tax=Kineobactrum salinum TaxID=2708301 RepID=A0A6C0U1B7_9GAMM|nr:PilC/PilY family type IV pilus protein [Kineobactrum salinum]QIB64777.1 hypothetical protein G3T16_04625 [Kineobactrum salinum]
MTLSNNDNGSNDRDPPHVECRDDVINGNPSNGPGVADGYARGNGVPNNAVFSAATPGESEVKWGNTSYTFYTAHYMDYRHDDSLVSRTRMEIAQEVVTGIILANPGIDFGLVEFNGNWSGTNHHGGRVIHRIIADMTEEQRSNVIDMVNSLTSAGSTPLCESSYEAYRYLSGQTLVYGHRMDGNRNPKGDYLPRDTLAESPLGTYTSPATDCAVTYVILMTDGEPQNDTHANNAIESLTGKTCGIYPAANQPNTKNCLPELAGYMATEDLDNDTTNGRQLAITYTVGFATDQDLLRDTAAAGKGEYYTANSADELTAAFQGAILSILGQESTLTSPAVAVDTFTRTQSRNEVFYAMFEPGESVDWPGNIKKLRLDIVDGEAVLVDKKDNAALDPETGFITVGASTFWSDADGPDVMKGGVGGLLAARDPATRLIYSNTGADGALETFNSTNMNREAFGLDTDEELFALFGPDIESQTDLDRELASGRGFAIDDDGTVSADARNWILGDILHSQPLVLSYGARTGFTAEDPDLRIIVGTNAGFLHMFGDVDGQEDWAFFPKELAPVLNQRRLDAISLEHVYGIDTSPVAYVQDLNNDGTIVTGDGDKVWLYFGLRRGGDAMYALDISDPDNPAFMWKIDPARSGFAELGLTWSAPVVTRIPGYRDAGGKPKPVLVFGAGYDLTKDLTGVATPDGVGRGLFIVDAETGELVWSVTPAANSLKNLQETGLQHAVPGNVTVLDSNGDTLADRMYFGDAGGNVWRVDLPGNALPDASQDDWQINKLAQLNGGTEATDRRFFNAPDVVRIRFNGKPVDAVLIGSGDRTNPNATDVDNRFYMLRDERTAPYDSSAPDASDCADMDPVTDFRCFMPVLDEDLYDITANLLSTGTDEEKAVAVEALQAANGWRIDLQHEGEKSLAKSLTLNGKVYIASFTPNTGLNPEDVCEPLAGLGRLYVVDLFSGNRNVIQLGPIIPDTPSVHFGEDDQIRLLLPPGTPAGDPDGDGDNDCIGGVCSTDEFFRPPYGTYWFQEEY